VADFPVVRIERFDFDIHPAVRSDVFACRHAQPGAGGKGSSQSSADNCLAVDGCDLGTPRYCAASDCSVLLEGRFTLQRGETALVELRVAFDRLDLLNVG